MLSLPSKRRLFYFLLALHVLGAYPLARAFFHTPITVIVAWNLFAGLMSALFLDGAISIRRGMGYLVALVAVAPFAAVVGLGYAISLGLARPIDPSYYWKAVQRGYMFSSLGTGLGFSAECFLRAVGAHLGSYLAGSLALTMAEKGFRSGRWWRVVFSLVGLVGVSLTVGLLFHFLNLRMHVEACHIVEDAGKNRTLADAHGDNPGWVIVVVQGKIPMIDKDEVWLSDSYRNEYPLTAESSKWVSFAIPAEVAKTEKLTLHVRGFPGVRLPDRRETRRGDEISL